MESLMATEASLSVEDRTELHFALGKAYDEIGRHADAFSHWQDGNALKRRAIAYDEAAAFRTMNRIEAVFSTEVVRRHENGGHPSAAPIFIVGMPRSGSTLIEQILASHPQVLGAGELKHFGRAVKWVQQISADHRPFPDLVLSLTQQQVHDLGERYLAALGRLPPSVVRVTDKMPMNFTFVGLIHLALPNAVIIHAYRDPVDTCLSCFSKLFADEQNYAYDLAELGRYYGHYRKMMSHWSRVLPSGRILDVRYEDVIADLEGQARRIVAHCGLEWDPRCLAFHQTVRPVRTASAVQVRQPLYNSSVARWHPYKDFLQPLLSELQSKSVSIKDTSSH
jgi:hypothetical protein